VNSVFRMSWMSGQYLQEALRRQLAPVHLFAAMLAGIGLTMLVSLAGTVRSKGPWLAGPLLQVAVLAVPLITLTRNWQACNRHGDDYGALFGQLMFEPGGGYQPMEKEAILFAGTDDARFVSTYMIFCESRAAAWNKLRDRQFDRSDIYLLAQNALADNTYMRSLRDQYDLSRPSNDTPIRRLLGRGQSYPQEAIRLPDQADANKAFQQYVEDVQASRTPAGNQVRIEKGGLQVQGVSGVMCINGILAQWIFDRNKEEHSFYVEESYAIPWMYSRLRPAGLIMKLEKEPLPTPKESPQLWRELIARDRAYWDALVSKLRARPDFRRNDEARRWLAKLRSAIGGIYSFRALPEDAEYAFTQAIEIYPEGTEARARLAELELEDKGQTRWRSF